MIKNFKKQNVEITTKFLSSLIKILNILIKKKSENHGQVR